MSTKKNITKKTSIVGLLTLLSRFFALFREMLLTKFLGANAGSDGFFTALKIPNALRKIFAEGAMTNACVPTTVQMVHVSGTQGISSLMSLMFLVFETIVFAICAIVMWYPKKILWAIAGGFSAEQIDIAAPWLQILMPLIFFVSSGSLLASALQSIGSFSIPAFTPILLNVVIIIGLLICNYNNLSVNALCWFFSIGCFVQFICHLIAYWRAGFTFSAIKKSDLPILYSVLHKFFISLLGCSIEEVNLFISTSFASYLKHGSISLLRYANLFINIPLGVFATALSTVLLPHFSRVSIFAPKRLFFYLLEAIKLVLWIMIPISITMAFFSTDIFSTLFISNKFSLKDAQNTGTILCILLPGLICSSLNKIFRNIYFSFHETRIPAIIAMIATGIEIGTSWLLLYTWQINGLALAISISQVTQTILFASALHYFFKFNLYLIPLSKFLYKYCLQLVCIGIPLWGMYKTIIALLPLLLPYHHHFFITSIGLWLWVGPLCGIGACLLYLTHRTFNIRLHFIE